MLPRAAHPSPGAGANYMGIPHGHTSWANLMEGLVNKKCYHRPNAHGTNLSISVHPFFLSVQVDIFFLVGVAINLITGVLHLPRTFHQPSTNLPPTFHQPSRDNRHRWAAGDGTQEDTRALLAHLVYN